MLPPEPAGRVDPTGSAARGEAEIATVTRSTTTGEKGLFFDVSVVEPDTDGSISTSLVVTGWIAHETADLKGVALRSSLGESIRRTATRPIPSERVERIKRRLEGRPFPQDLDRLSGFRIEVPALELAEGADLILAVHLRHADGTRTRTDLASVSDLPTVHSDTRYHERVSPLMVVGQGRSGSTLLMALLSQHPSIAVPGGYPFEFREASYLWHAARVLIDPAEYESSRSGFEVKDPTTLTFDPYNRAEFHANVANAAVRQWHQRDRPAQVIDFMKQQVDQFVLAARSEGSAGEARYVAEKMQPTPMVHIMSNVYPGGRRIFLVRDFRDVFCSARAFNSKRGTAGFGADAHADELTWLESMGSGARRVLRYLEAYPKASLLVRYEDLVQRMDEELTRIFLFLEVAADAALVSRAAAMGREQAKPEKHSTTADASESVGRWRRELTAQERNAAMAFGDVLKAFRYAMHPGGAGGPSQTTRESTGDTPAPVPAGRDERQRQRRDRTRAGKEGNDTAQRPGARRPPADRPRKPTGPQGQNRPQEPAKVDTSHERPSLLAADRVRAGLRDPLKAMRTLTGLRSGVLLRLDAPSPDESVYEDDQILVSGWTFSRQAPIERVEIRLDGHILATVRPDHERLDVSDKYPGIAAARDSGFHRRVKVHDVQPGIRELTVSATDERGNQETVSLPIVVEASASVAEAGRRLSRSIVPGMPEGALLFMHIPKTAGTSMRDLLDQLIPAESRVYLYPTSPIGIPPTEFKDLPQEVRDRLRFVMGHFRFGLHEELTQPTRYVTMMRDPIARLVSLYHHHKRNRRSRLHDRILEGSLSLEEVLRDPFLVPENHMASQISGLYARGSVHEEMLERALANIEAHFAAVLIMEDMPRSIVRLSEILGTDLPEVPRSNVDPHAPKRESIDPGLIDHLRQRNRIDVELYERAKKAFDASFDGAAPSVDTQPIAASGARG